MIDARKDGAPRRAVKQGLDGETTRRNREDFRTQVRKGKREEHLLKRRALAAAARVDVGSESGAMTTSSMDNAVGASTGGTNTVTTNTTHPPKKVYTVDDIPALMATMSNQHADEAPILEAVRGFRRMLSIERNPPVVEVIQSGALPYFVHFLGRNDHEMLQFEAAWALTNVASTEHTAEVVKAGVIPLLVNLLRSPYADVREQSGWCLGNIAGDSVEFRNEVLHAGAVMPLLQNIAQPSSPSLLANMVWALSNFCRGKPHSDLQLVGSAIPVLAQMVKGDNKDVIVDAAWALSYLSDGDDDRIGAVMHSGVAPTLVSLLKHESVNVVTPALRTLGNFVSGNDLHTQAVVEAGVLDHIEDLLSHGRKNIRKESCWLLSNIAAGTEEQIDLLLKKRGIRRAVIRMINEDEWEVRREATWVVSNVATGGNDAQIGKIVEAGGVDALCSMLETADAKIVLVAMDALERILATGMRLGLRYDALVDEAEGIEKLEKLQEHCNNEIYEKALAMIERYFGVEDTIEDENVAPSISDNQFSFGTMAGAANTNFDASKLISFHGGTAAAGGGGTDGISRFGYSTDMHC